MWGQASVELISDSGWRIRSEIVPMTVLITDGVEGRSLGIVTTFCHHDQAKDGVICSALHLTPMGLSLTKHSVVRIFANSHYLLWGSSSFLYLDVTTLSSGALTAQFPLDQLCLWQWLSYSPTLVILLHEAEDKELKFYPIHQEMLWESSEEDLHLSDPILLLGPPSPFFIHQEESSGTEEGPSLSLALVQLQSMTWVRAQLEQELAHEWEGLVRRYED